MESTFVIDFREPSEAKTKMRECLDKGDLCWPQDLPEPPNDMVILEDSDEEMVDDSSSEEEMEVEITPRINGDAHDETNGRKATKNLIDEILEASGLQSQVDQSIQKLDERLAKQQDDFDEINDEFAKIARHLHELRDALYQPYEPKREQLAPIDINDEAPEQRRSGRGREKTAGLFELPIALKVAPKGVPSDAKFVNLPDPEVGVEVFAAISEGSDHWAKAKVVSKESLGFKVKFNQIDEFDPESERIVSSKEIALTGPPPFRLSAGAKVIVHFGYIMIFFM